MPAGGASIRWPPPPPWTAGGASTGSGVGPNRLDPHSAMTGGVGGVIAYVVTIAAAIALIATGVVWVRRRRGLTP